MRQFAVLLIAVLLAIGAAGCGREETVETITFTATVEEISDYSILVTTQDDVGFDKACVSYADGLAIGLKLSVGQALEIEIMPEIRESYPVQVTAISIKQAP